MIELKRDNSQTYSNYSEIVHDVRKLSEAASADGYSLDFTIDGKPGWRQANSSGLAELLYGDVDRSKMLKTATKLFRTSPLAQGIISTHADIISSDEVAWIANDERVEKALNDFWFGRINKWNRRINSRITELYLFGEQVFPVFVDERTGLVVTKSISPGRIHSVLVDKDDRDEIKGIKITDLKAKGNLSVLKVVNVNKDVTSTEFNSLEGDCFYWSNTSLIEDPRGYSDLLVLADWITIADGIIKASGERTAMQLSVFYDVKMDGADEKMMAAEQAKFNGITPGQAYVHSEDIETKAMGLELGAQETAINYRSAVRHIASGAKLPEHWLGIQGDATATTAEAMNPPTMKMLQNKRNKVQWMLQDLGDFVIEKAQRYGNIPENADISYEVVMPEINDEKVENVSRALSLVVAGASAANSFGYITAKTASQAVSKVLEKSGIKYDPEKEIELAQAEKPNEKADRGVEDLYKETNRQIQGKASQAIK